MLKKNDVIPLLIEDIASDGNGIGRYNGFAVFVANTAPNDLINAKIVKLHRSYAYGIIVELLEPSPDRIESTCPCSLQCGGCDFRHISYEAELRLKRKFVADALCRIGGIDYPVQDCEPSPLIDRYRNKVIFPVAQQNGNLVAGLFAPRSHRLLPETLDCCLLQPRELNEIARQSCAFLQQSGISAYDEVSKSGLLRHILLRRSDLDGSVLLCLVINGDSLPNEPGFCTAITTQFPAIKTVVINSNKRAGNAVLGDKTRVLFGDGYLNDSLCGVPARLSPNSFFQINNGAASLLYRAVGDFASPKPDETLLDLYCGVGTIGLSMAAQFNRLISVENVESAVTDAKENAKAMGFSNAEFIYGDAAKAAAAIVAQNTKIDCIVTDPPRKGCDAQTLEAMLLLSPSRIIMVSCNPATLARDLKILL